MYETSLYIVCSYKQASGHKHPPPPGYEPSFKRIKMNSIYLGVLKHNFKNTVNVKRFLIGTTTGFSKRFFSITDISPSLLKPLTKMNKPRVYRRQFTVFF